MTDRTKNIYTRKTLNCILRETGNIFDLSVLEA